MRQAHRLPEAVDASDVASFLADLETHRDRAITLAKACGNFCREVGPGGLCPHCAGPVAYEDLV